jgi:hypothetical protein
MRYAMLLVPAAMALGVAASAAQDDEGGRYALERSADGYVRMDKETGEMSICQERSGQLVCKLAADDRQAFESEMDRLQSSVDALEKRVTALEGSPSKGLPSEEEFDKTMTYMQRFFRGFMDIVKEWDRELRGPEETTPQRT